MRKNRQWLVMLLALVVVLVMTGCSQPKQVGTRSVSSTAEVIAAMTPGLTFKKDGKLDSGAAAAATYLIKNRYDPGTTGGEETSVLAEELRRVSNTSVYNNLSAPSTSGVTRMARLYLYPDGWDETKVAHSISRALLEMDGQLPDDNKSRSALPDRYMSYTYTYTVSVQQAYGDQASAWVIGVMVEQTAKETNVK